MECVRAGYVCRVRPLNRSGRHIIGKSGIGFEGCRTENAMRQIEERCYLNGENV